MGPPQSLSAAGDEVGVPLLLFGGWRAELGPAEGDEEAAGGIFKENTLEQQLLDSYTRWLHSAPSLVEQPAQQPQGRLWTGPVPWGDMLRASSTRLC